MKLNIGQNIRTLRRAADMTQDELAVKLGVAFQTVSRWENGGAYPDMELLPAIAGIFDVTVDHLLGTDTEKKQKQLNEIVRRLLDAIRSNPREDDTVVAILRELRRDIRQYAEYISGMHSVWHALRWYRNNAPAKVLEEIRLFHQEYCLYAPRVTNMWWPAWAMSVIEDDEHLEELLKKYCTEKKFTVEELLFNRYSLRGEYENRSYMEELCRYTALRKLFEDNFSQTLSDRGMTEYNIAALHLLHGITPDPKHPISGDGKLDLWVDIRTLLGWRLAEICLECGEVDRAVIILVDVIDLFKTLVDEAEKAKKENRTLELSSTASILPTFRITAYAHWATETRDGQTRSIPFASIRYNRFRDSGEFESWRSVTPENILISFEDICRDYADDPRFHVLHDRMKALIREPKQ